MQEKNISKEEAYLQAIIFSLVFIAPAIVFRKHGLDASLFFLSILIGTLCIPYIKSFVRKVSWLIKYIFLIYTVFYLSILLNYLKYVDSTLTTFLIVVICFSQVCIGIKISKSYKE